MKITLKHLLLITVGFLITLNFVSCEDILSEDPKTFLSEDASFSSEGGAIASTLGIYESLRSGTYYGQRFFSATILHSDYAYGRGSYVPMGNYTMDATNVNRVGDLWTSIYASINRANIVINKVPEIDGINSSLANKLVGEARFLRALGYYHLVRLWGGVPLRLEPETSDFSLARSSIEEVYSQIIADLQYAEDNLPSTYSASDIGRATSWAAKTLLADVYLTRENWAESAAKAQEVIDSGLFSLVEVSSSDDFQTKLFGPDIPTHSEEILAIKYSIEQNNDSFLRFFHRSGPGYSEGGPHVYLGNLGSFISQGEWATEDSPDLRRNHTLYSGADTLYLDDNVQMLFRKFRGTTTNVSNDTPLLRYAEALLIFAEAESQLNDGPNAAAYEAVNMVRRRAYGMDTGTPSSEADFPSGMTAQEFREAILLERAKEFLGEGKRWFDLLRTNTAIDVAKEAGKTEITEKNLKFPIPQEEIDNNEALSQSDQNPGW